MTRPRLGASIRPRLGAAGRRRWSLTLVASALGLACACDALAPRSEGERIYRRLCADCHGVDGSGNTPRSMGNPWADLTDDAWKSEGGDAGSIETVVREGVFGEMPAHDELSAEEMRALLGHLLALRGEAL